MRKLKLTWQAGKGRPGRWRRVYRGRALVFPGGRGKSDTQAYQEALDAFERRKREIDAEEDRRHQPAYERAIDEWERVLAGALQRGEQYWQDMAEERLKDLRARLEAPQLAPLKPEDWAGYRAKLRPIWEWFAIEDRLKAPAAAPKGTTVRDYLETFLSQKRAQAAAGTLSTARVYALDLQVGQFAKWIGPDTAVETMDSPTLTRYHGWILEQMASGKWGRSTAWHYWVACKAFVMWLYDMEVIDLPRVLKRLSIAQPPARIDVFTVEELRQLLNAATSRVKLFCLLGLNAGFTQVDLANLRPEEVGERTITRRRSKTRDIASTPVVCYRLWPATWELLEKHRSPGERVLVNRNGTPLVADQIVDGKYRKQDAVRNCFDRLKRKVGIEGRSFRSLRKTGASMIKDSAFGDVVQTYLGHSARTVADQHYARPPQGRLDEALEWLRNRLALTDPA